MKFVLSASMMVTHRKKKKEKKIKKKGIFSHFIGSILAHRKSSNVPTQTDI